MKIFDVQLPVNKETSWVVQNYQIIIQLLNFSTKRKNAAAG